MKVNVKVKKEQKQRFSLTLLFTGVVGIIFIAVLVLVAIGLYLFLETGVLFDTVDDFPVGKLLLIFVASSAIVGLALTMLLSKYPLKPINGLINIMNRLASGDFSPRIALPKPWDRYPGMAELSESFNKMAEELGSTELLRHDFVNNFSHEFKTPIVSIAGFAKLLKREQLTEKQLEYVSIIEEESLRLSRMATNVLMMTKVENQSILTDVSRFNLSEQLRDSILLLIDKWEKKELEFSLEFPEYMINASEELLKQVWINLLDNAIKFSPEKSVITVSILELPSQMQVAISNFGPTISEEKQQRIFRKFYQADESHASSGSGVGLAIVKRVVELHSGTVVVESHDGSTTFTVILPR